MCCMGYKIDDVELMTAVEKSFKNMKQYLILILFFFSLSHFIHAQEWQWSVPVEGVISNETNDHPRLFCGYRQIANRFVV